MDSTVAAAVLGAVVAGLGGLLVPRLIAGVPRRPPPPQEERASEKDATVDARAESAGPEVEAPPEPYADIAALPGLAWKAGLAGVLVGAVVGAAVGWEWAWVLCVPFVPVYLALTVIDWRTRLLPTYLIGPTLLVLAALALVGWAVTGDGSALLRSGLGFATCGGVLLLLLVVPP